MDLFEAAPALEAPRSHHGEGPIWDAAAQRLWWTDVLAGTVHRARVEDGAIHPEHAFDVGGTVGAVVPVASGGLILLADDGFTFLSADGTTRRLLNLPTERRGVTRMNDGGCDPLGRLWAGTMAFDGSPGQGNLYRTELDGSTRIVLRGTTISNGIGWSRDGETMLFVDSGPRSISRFDLAAGEPRDRRTFRAFEGATAPDGLVMDDEDCAWVAMWGGGEVHRYAPDGELLAVVQVPTRQPSSVAFAGADRDVLVISTSQQGLDEATLTAEPTAGLLHVATVGAQGPSATPFAGSIEGWSFER